MPIRFLLTTMLAALCASAHAQKESVVLDMETKMPVSGVVVTVNSAVTSQLLTNYRGLFLLPAAVFAVGLIVALCSLARSKKEKAETVTVRRWTTAHRSGTDTPPNVMAYCPL